MSRSRHVVAVVLILLSQSACSTQQKSPHGATVTVTIGHAQRMKMPRIAAGIGEILPGAQPFIGATGRGTILSYAIKTGQTVKNGEAVATIQPNRGPAIVVHAKVTATVQSILAPVGAAVTPGTPLVGITGRDVRQARLPFPLTTAAHFFVGETVILHSPLHPKGRLPTHITALAATASGHAMDAYTDLPPLPGFAPGSPIRADIVLTQASVVAVPIASVVLRPMGTVVFLIRHHHAHETIVKVGLKYGGWAAVSGLAPGSVVAKDNADKLRNGTPVRIRADA